MSSSECKVCSAGGKATTIIALVLSILAAFILVTMVVHHLKLHKKPPHQTEDVVPSNHNSGGSPKDSAVARLGTTGVAGSVKKLFTAAGSIKGLLDEHLPSVSRSASLLKEKTNLGANFWSKMGPVGKILLSFTQIINQIKFAYDIPFPVNFSDFISSLGFVNLDILTMVGMGCVAPFSFYGKLFAMTLIPIALAALIYYVYKSSSSEDVKHKCIAGFLKMTYLVFPGVSTAVFQTFSCITFDTKESFLKQDLSIDCNAAEERPVMLAYAILMVILYPMGITAMYAILLWRQRKEICPIEGEWHGILGIKDVFPPKLRTMDEEDKMTEQRRLDIPKNPELNSIQFLFKEYEPYYWWYEVFECFRRLMLTGGSVMFMEGSATQVVCGMLIALLSIHVQTICQPFIEDDDDVLALGAQWGILFTLFGGLLLKLQLNSADGYDEDGTGFGAFLIVVNVLVILVGVGTFLYGAFATEFTSALGSLWAAIVNKFRCRFGCSTASKDSAAESSTGQTKELGLSEKKEDKAVTTINPAFERSASLRPESASIEPTSVV
jgi:hypothetical protein